MNQKERRMISLVIPCYNERDVLPATYEAVAAEAELWSQPVEIIFVDDGSTDETSVDLSVVRRA